MIILVTAFLSEDARRDNLNPLGSMLVSTLAQFNEALRVYADPPCYIAFKDENGSDLGERGIAREMLLRSIKMRVTRQLKYPSHGRTTARLAQMVGVPTKELSVILTMLCGDEVIKCTGDVWTLVKE